MPAVTLLKIYIIGTAFSILWAIYGMVDSLGGLMYVMPNHYIERGGGERKMSVRLGSSIRLKSTLE